MSKKSNNDNNYLSFEIDGELFGINLINLNQIIEAPELTKVPMSSAQLEGIILHNEEMLPIINFQNWLNVKKDNIGERRNILVVELKTKDGVINVGIRVDKVIEVINFEESKIEKVPKVSDADSKHIRGVVNYLDSFIMLIDINQLFTATELEVIEGSRGDKIEDVIEEAVMANRYINTYLSFTIGNEKLAVEADKVIEILNVKDITTIPGADEYMVGIVNIRGSVLPVIDPRLKFQIDTSLVDFAKATIMVLDVNVNGENHSVGAVVDTVTNIIEIDADLINTSVSLDLPFNPEYLHGVAKVDNEFIQIINLDKVFELDKDSKSIQL